MSSEPSERARAWVNEHEDSEFVNAESPLCIDMMIAFDAGFVEGEKKGAADSYEAGIRVGRIVALREVNEECALRRDEASHGYIYETLERFGAWLDRRIREAEEGR